MDSIKDLASFAQRLWDNFFARKLKESQRSGVRYYRAEVTGAAADGKLAVKRPFDTQETALPYVSSMAGAQVGEQVVVLVFGDGGNAGNRVVFMYPDGRNL